jgi:predicted PurR-regulated permease PerM
MPELVGPQTVERFRRWGIVAWSTIGVLLLASSAVWVLLQVHEIFPPLFVALITIYMLNPLVTRLESRGMRRVYSGCLSYLVMLAILTAAVALLIPVLVDQGQAFAKDLPEAVDRVGELAQNVGDDVTRRFGGEFDLREWISGRSDLVADVVGGVGGFLRSAASAIALIVIGLVLGFYLLVDLPRMRRGMLVMVPPERRDEARKVAAAVAAAMGGFFRGQLLVALIVAVMSSIGLMLIGLPYWAVIGLIAGVFNLIPLIGPFVGAVPAMLIAAATGSPWRILLVAVVLTVVQQIDNHFISPNVMRWSVQLHPVTVMLSLTVGATLGGLFGMLVAVPIAASLKIVAAHLWRTRVPWGEEVFELEERLERGPPGRRPAVLPEKPPEVGSAASADRGPPP